MSSHVGLHPAITAFYEPVTSSVSYVVADPQSRHCAVIDSVLNYDPRNARTNAASADAIIAFVKKHDLAIDWVLDTHVHADHMTAAPYIRTALGGRMAIGARVSEVQRIFQRIYNIDREFAADGSQFDHLFADGETFAVGGIPARVLHTPGHTPACVSFIIGDTAFVGDVLLMPVNGTARCDFPGGDARVLYRSLRRLLDLPPATRICVAHDYEPRDLSAVGQTTVETQRRENVHVKDGVGEEEFVARRTARDATLELPALMLAAVQVNIRGGALPPMDGNGIRYLKIPLNCF